ncbi:transcription factor Ken-like isoform X2 [Octopus vulgaris]|uniref:Transcription factor Ken-like isoform X2 n=1 Tax=Octopus vulgaris TaxID=6645 RepID=A0AA36F0P6_OCTVU|nr:transcription factor Ken-like isoform X2 [Octopus vulgaris]
MEERISQQRAAARERQRRRRQRLSTEERQAVRDRIRERMQKIRSNMNQEERELYLQNRRNRDRERRNNMDQHERELYLQNKRDKDQERRNNMNPEERETYLQNMRNRVQKRRNSMNEDQPNEVMHPKLTSLGHLTKHAKKAREKQKRETTEEKQLRLQNQRQRQFVSQQAETAGQRQMKMIQEKKNETQHLGEQRLQNQKLKNQQSHDRWQMDSALSSPKTSKCVHLTTKMPVQQDSSLAQASQNITKPAQVLTSPFQITPSKSKLVKDPNQTTVSKSIIRITDLPKQRLLVTSHHRYVMSNLASMWRSRKLCDASISNGSSTVMVHKIVLSAVSPKLFSVFSTYISSQVFEVKFPEVVSTEALMAFAEYIYTGLLDLDLNILQQLKVIAKQLDMKDLQNMCDAHLQSGTRQQLASTVTAFDDSRQMPSNISAVPTEDIKQEISQNELAQLKEGTVRIFKREFEAASLDTNGGNSPFGSDILPTVKIEPVGPDDDKYGQMNKRASTSSSVSDSSQALNTPLNSIAISTTDFSLPFSDTTNSKATTNKIYGTSPKLKCNVFESSPVSDLSPVSYSEEKLCSESRLIREDSSKSLNRTTTTQLIDNNVICGSNEDVYPVGLFTAEGDRLPLSSTQVTNVKNTGLYKTDGFT